MSNNKYAINKYTESILDDLGYEVIHGPGIQDVYGLKDKKSGNFLPCNKVELCDLSEEELLKGMSQLVPGVKASVFTGTAGEEIYLDEFGGTEIYFGDRLKVNIPRFDDIHEVMDISINYGKDKEKSVSFIYGGYEGTKQSILSNGIYVEGYNPDANRITSITCRGTEWGNYKETHSVDECTNANIINKIITGLRSYKKGYFWDDDLKFGLEVIGPALDLYAVDFKNDWVKYLDNIVLSERESQREARRAIDENINIIVQSKARVNEVRDVKSSLLADPEVKSLRKRQNEVKD